MGKTCCSLRSALGHQVTKRQSQNTNSNPLMLHPVLSLPVPHPRVLLPEETGHCLALLIRHSEDSKHISTCPLQSHSEGPFKSTTYYPNHSLDGSHPAPTPRN